MIDFNTRIDDNDPCWLIKIDTRIEGPFSFNEVLSKLTSGEFFSQNEVMAPLDRWRTLQSHPLYAAAVEKLRRQSDVTSEYTMTKTERTSFTRTLDINFETMTPTPMRDTPPPLPDTPVVTPPKPLVTPPVFYPTKKNKSTLPALGVGIFLIAIIVVYLVLNKKPQVVVKEDLKQSSMVSLFDKGFFHKQRGEWQEALKNFRQAYQLNKKDLFTVFELAPLLIQVDSHTEYARGMVETVMLGKYKAEDVCVGKNAIGLSYSYEGYKNKENYKRAVKNYDDCLAMNNEEGSQFERLQIAQLNKGFALMMLGKFSNAEATLANTKSMQNQTMTPYLFIIENYITEGYKTNSKLAYEKAFNLASQISTRRFYDGLQEILLFHAYAAYKLGKDPAYVASVLEKSLYIDPDLTMDHLHSPLIDWRVYDWKNFSFICKDLKNINKLDLVALLDFTCSYKMNNEIGAQQALGGWLTRSQEKSSMPHVAQAILSNRLGEYDKAKDSLSLAKKFNANDKLYYQTLTKVCARRKDEECLQSNMDNISRLAPLQGYYARAILDLDKQNNIRKGLLESPHYLPLVRLQ
jgi:tetratricopeptide (TPR) repeat protein